MKFNTELLRDIASDCGDSEHVLMEDHIIDHGRWTVTHKMVFKHDGHFYSWVYSVGATEAQEGADGDDPEESEVIEVFPFQRTVTCYTPRCATADAAAPAQLEKEGDEA